MSEYKFKIYGRAWASMIEYISVEADSYDEAYQKAEEGCYNIEDSEILDIESIDPYNIDEITDLDEHAI